MTFDDIVDLLTQISLYAGIAAIVLFAVLFVLTAIVRSNNKKKLAAGTADPTKPGITKTGG
ncbi:hypothetical protein sos41_08270 [Alphaproteobacteria bacterium SO-S41]|nr:hypothetical protein sos41_08270 [Alphaproteobacteria bacterium SO-S41]